MRHPRSKLLYAEEHTQCLNYEAGDNPIIERIDADKGRSYDYFFSENTIVFITKGKIVFSFGDIKRKEAESKKIFALPPGYFHFSAEVCSSLIVFRLRSLVSLCDQFPLENLFTGKGDHQYEFRMLDFDRRVVTFIKSLNYYLDDGLKCIHMLENKITEFFLILRGYYRKEDLLAFFHPLFQWNSDFANFIFRNYKRVNSVKELADLSHYSLSGMEKRFKKVFGVSIYQWIKEQRIRSIFKDINCSGKSFKEISYMHGFSSPSYFNDFCKAHFGETPGQLRKKALKNGLSIFSDER